MMIPPKIIYIHRILDRILLVRPRLTDTVASLYIVCVYIFIFIINSGDV
jgi:hypothetical protein